MTKTVSETKPAADTSAVPPLSPGVRRHLGRTLRSHYAECLTEPVGERLATLLTRLAKTRE